MCTASFGGSLGRQSELNNIPSHLKRGCSSSRWYIRGIRIWYCRDRRRECVTNCGRREGEFTSCCAPFLCRCEISCSILKAMEQAVIFGDDSSSRISQLKDALFLGCSSNIEYWFRKLNYYNYSSQSITFVFLFHHENRAAASGLRINDPFQPRRRELRRTRRSDQELFFSVSFYI